MKVWQAFEVGREVIKNSINLQWSEMIKCSHLKLIEVLVGFVLERPLQCSEKRIGTKGNVQKIPFRIWIELFNSSPYTGWVFES